MCFAKSQTGSRAGRSVPSDLGDVDSEIRDIALLVSWEDGRLGAALSLSGSRLLECLSVVTCDPVAFLTRRRSFRVF